jgi:hypothetical protein
MGGWPRLPSAIVGSTSVHLCMCETCGHIGCCDQSPEPAREGAPPGDFRIRSSALPRRGEDWSCCFVDDVAFVLTPS